MGSLVPWHPGFPRKVGTTPGQLGSFPKGEAVGGMHGGDALDMFSRLGG